MVRGDALFAQGLVKSLSKLGQAYTQSIWETFVVFIRCSLVKGGRAGVIVVDRERYSIGEDQTLVQPGEFQEN